MIRRRARVALALGLVVLALAGGLRPARAADSAVVLVYQRVGETKHHPLESVTRAQFDAHLAHLKQAGFRVMKLREIVASLVNGQAIPEHTVAITFDNAFKSAYREAWPRLEAAGLPFSVFVASDAVDAKDPDVMSWDELRALAAAGVTIESRGASNRRLWRLDGAAQRDDIARGRARIEEEVGDAPKLFAYPSGERSGALAALVEALGFEAAFGLRSGTLHAADDRYALPRFELNERFADLERFKMIAKVLPLPIRDLVPEDAILAEPKPRVSFTVDEGVGPLDALTCHVSRQGPAEIALLARRVTVELSLAFRRGHDNRINCTLRDSTGRTRWLGLQYVVP